MAGALAALLGASASHSAEWRWNSDLSMNAGWQQNPLLSVDPGPSDERLGLDLYGTLNHSNGSSQWSFDSRLDSWRYSEHRQLDNQTANVHGGYAFTGERNNASVSLTGVSDTTMTSELGNSGLTSGNRRHQSAELTLGTDLGLSERSTLTVAATGNVNTYAHAEGSGLSNYRFMQLDLRQSWQLSELGSVAVELAGDRLFSDAYSYVQRDLSASLIFRRASGERWSWYLQGGGNRRLRDTQTDQSVIASAGLTRSFERGSLQLDLSRNSAPLGNGYLTLRNSATLTASHRLGERLAARLSLQALQSEQLQSIFGFTIFSGSTWWNLAGRLEWALRPKLDCSLQFTRAQAQYAQGGPWGRDTLVQAGLSWHPGG